jgi:hypothetical protein
VVSSFGLEFAGEQAVSEAGRVLQSGGVFTGVTLKPGSVALARVVVSGRIAKRILKIQIEDDAGKKFRVYSELAGEINSAGWSFPGSAFERFFARLAFKDYAEKAFFGNLTDRDIASLRVQAVAGDRLEWFAQLDEDGIREVFRKNGFESVELREVTFKRGFNLDPVRDVVRVVNFDPTRQTAFSGEHKALGIIARKRNEPAEGATRVIVINDGYVAAWLRGNVKGYGSLHRNTQRRLIEGIKAEILEHPDMVSDFVTARVFSDAFNRAKAKMGMRPSELPLAGEDLGRVRGAKNGKGAKLDRFRSFKRTIGR